MMINLETAKAIEGAPFVVLPVPAFYPPPKTVDDIINHTVGRCLDLFNINMSRMASRRRHDATSGFKRVGCSV
jgi:3-polyprenyl-4-hydroxybenzoate decarboxylase